MSEEITQEIFDAKVGMTASGIYLYHMVDFVNDVTYDGVIPDQYISMLPGFLQQLQALSQ